MKYAKFYQKLNLSLTVYLIIGISFLYCQPLQSHIIEPDNIIYGEIFDNQGQQITAASGAKVTLEVEGVELASYTMGENVSAGDYYILNVPLDSEAPEATDRAQMGDTATIKVDGQEITAINDISGSTITIGARGTVIQKKLSTDIGDYLCGNADLSGTVDIFDALLVAEYDARLKGHGIF